MKMRIPSPVESYMFYSPGVWDGLWDTKCIENRRKLRENLDKILSDQPLNWSDDLIGLYESLNDLLSSGNDRFVLYCPFNIIPDASWYRQCDPSLDTFIELYLKSWHRLLSHHDLRANFTDGDIENTERVVQAAYIVPELVRRGLLSSDQVSKLLKSDDEVLVKSLQESFGCVEPPQKSYNLEIADKKRAKWIEWEQHRQFVEHNGGSLATSLINGFDLPNSTNPEIAVVAIRQAIERLWACGQADDAKVLYDRYEQNMIGFADIKFFCRLHSIGIAPDSTLDKLGITPPNLAGPFFSHVSADDGPIIDSIYPVKILFGSRLKGYGSHISDSDYAVFVKPGQDRDFVNGLLGPDVFQYWLEEDGDVLRISGHAAGDSNLGYSSDIHVLLCGVWVGDVDTVKMLRDRLLAPLIAEYDRELWLWQMERDLLQYRLLHRGYEDFYVPRRPVFLDDGYRMIASKLYASYIWV